MLRGWVSELTRERWGGVTPARKAEGTTTQMLQPLHQTTSRNSAGLATYSSARGTGSWRKVWLEKPARS